MASERKNLEKLILFIEEIANNADNTWFKEELHKRFSYNVSQTSNSSLDEIYEYCIKKIIQEQAEKFYLDFKLISIRGKLIEDFFRMEKFKRDDKFEDFCLALFQQIENIVNSLISNDLRLYINEHKDDMIFKDKNKNSNKYELQPLWKLIFFPEISSLDLNKKLKADIFSWDFSERYKTVLFFFYFKKKIYDYNDFKSIFFKGRELYQSRNQVHRGGKVIEKQQFTIEKILSKSHKYYFKFLGFLEDFTSTINLNIETEIESREPTFSQNLIKNQEISQSSLQVEPEVILRTSDEKMESDVLQNVSHGDLRDSQQVVIESDRDKSEIIKMKSEGGNDEINEVVEEL